MDIKEIIKWFIPCFHMLLKMNGLFLIILFFNLSLATAAVVSDVNLSANLENAKNFNVSIESQSELSELNEARAMGTEVGRTFGRPFKKMMGALLPLIFQIGAASTWAVVAALVGVKTLFVTLVILKLLLVAGAAKFGALFASKGHHHQSHGWEHQQQKEIHLHIHNDKHGGIGGYEEHAPISSWSRDGTPVPLENKPVHYVLDPYTAGPQTIHTPYGNYVKVEPSTAFSSNPS